jgi:hypothetical protein
LAASRTFVLPYPIRHHAAAAAIPAPETLYERHDRCIRRKAEFGQRLVTQNAFMAANQAAHEHNEIATPHGQSLGGRCAVDGDK